MFEGQNFNIDSHLYVYSMHFPVKNEHHLSLSSFNPVAINANPILISWRFAILFDYEMWYLVI
jgi:hypothetical protein